MHDPRIGRFFSIDPLAPEYPHNSPYAFSENQVIAFVELEGLEKAPTRKDANGKLFAYQAKIRRLRGNMDGVALSNVKDSPNLLRFFSFTKEGRFIRRYWYYRDWYLTGGDFVLRNIDQGENSAAVTARRFHKASGFPKSKDETKLPNGVGNLRNAIRHSLGQAVAVHLTNLEIAIQAGNAKEGGRVVYHSDLFNLPDVFNGPQKISIWGSYIDQHNNVVGRQVALDNPNATPKELAFILLEAMKEGKLLMMVNHGTIKDPDLELRETSMTEEEYQRAVDGFNKVDDYGNLLEEKKKE